MNLIFFNIVICHNIHFCVSSAKSYFLQRDSCCTISTR